MEKKTENVDTCEDIDQASGWHAEIYLTRIAFTVYTHNYYNYKEGAFALRLDFS